MLLSDVANINVLLDRMQDLAEDSDDPNAKSALRLLTSHGTFKTCEILLRSAENCLGSCQAGSQRLKNLGRALKWPLTGREIKDTMRQLRVVQDQITTALSVDSA